MERGRFEDTIKDQFEGASAKAPHRVWSNVEGMLNADLVHLYHGKYQAYKWSSIAAVMLALISFSVLFIREQIEINDPSTEGYYNALLSGNSNFSEHNGTLLRDSFGRALLFTRIPKSTHRKYHESIMGKEVNAGQVSLLSDDFIQVSRATSGLSEAPIHYEIYPYHKGIYLSKSTTRKQGGDDRRLWAGVEAGAGNFNSSLQGTEVFTGSINQASLADAIGTNGFINPTTAVNPNVNPGIAKSIGLDLGMRLGEKWTLETGFFYTNVDSRGGASINVVDIYTVDNDNFIGLDDELPLGGAETSRETPIEVRDSYDYNVDLESNIQFTSVPMKAGYFLLDDKVSLRLNVGLAANYFMGSEVNGSNEILNGSVDNSFNEWSFDGLGGLELGYSLFKKIDVTIEPNYRHAITPLNVNSESSNSRFLVQTGIRYKIQ